MARPKSNFWSWVDKTGDCWICRKEADKRAYYLRKETSDE